MSRLFEFLRGLGYAWSSELRAFSRWLKGEV
jgi:hypothetical protein